MKRHIFRFAALALCSQILLAQQQVALTPVKDNTLYQTADGSLSDGSGDYLFVGRVGGTGGGAIRRALLKFDLASAIPSGATITLVKLTLNMSKTTAGPESVFLQKLTADWGEGASNATFSEGSGAPSAANDATWIHRFFPTTYWTNAGGDFASTITASTQVNAVGSYTWGSTTQMVADAQRWLADPSSDFGWILIGDETTVSTAKRFDSRENSVVANRPNLTVTYTTATAIGDIAAVPTEIALAQNYPNPFNPSTTIRYELPKSANVTVKIFNTLGQEIAVLVNERKDAGSYQVRWNANVPSGIYFYRLQAGDASTGSAWGFVETKKAILLK